MTYFGRPEDLDEPEMSPEIKRIADAVLPLFTTGKRHAGTTAHRLRFAPARNDLPLGQRTAAKLQI